MFWILVVTLLFGAAFLSGLRGDPYRGAEMDDAFYWEEKGLQGCIRLLIAYPLYYGSAYLLHYFFDVLSSLTFGWFTFILIMGHFVIVLSSSWTGYKNDKKR